MKRLSRVLRYFKPKRKQLLDGLRLFLSAWLVLSQFLFGFPLDQLLKKPLVVKPVHATSATHDFSECTTTCDTDAGWWASADDVDVFPFASTTANRNTHTEFNDTEFSNIASSDNTYSSSANPGTGDEIFSWFEMTVTEDPASIRQLDFTFEGYPSTTTSNFSIWVKTAAGAYQDNASWTQVGTTTSITANTDTTITGSLTNNISDYIDGSGVVVWGVYNVTSAFVTRFCAIRNFCIHRYTRSTTIYTFSTLSTSCLIICTCSPTCWCCWRLCRRFIC